MCVCAPPTRKRGSEERKHNAGGSRQGQQQRRRQRRQHCVVCVQQTWKSQLAIVRRACTTSDASRVCRRAALVFCCVLCFAIYEPCVSVCVCIYTHAVCNSHTAGVFFIFYRNEKERKKDIEQDAAAEPLRGRRVRRRPEHKDSSVML